ncbi:putative leucine-rich repeat domain superfamily [Dioscorea sansibarensis]
MYVLSWEFWRCMLLINGLIIYILCYSFEGEINTYIYIYMKMEKRKKGEEEKEKEEHKVDLSGMSLDSFPNTSLNLACITKLDLSNNNLQSIPESIIARMLNLVVLDLHSNQLSVLPNSIGCLSKLKVLNVSSNMLESLPKMIENCRIYVIRALEELNTNFNKLTKLPETIGFELTKLEKLSVNSNKLIFLPFSTSHLTGLQHLDVHLNCLRSLSDDLENLINLKTLNISQNFHFLHSLPDSIGLLTSLTELNISYNSITTLPNSFACLTNLTKFMAEGNPLVCPPMEVVVKGVDEVRDFMNAKMSEGFKVGGKGKKIRSSTSSKTTRRGAWLKRMVKCGAFDGRMVYMNEGLLITPEHEMMNASDKSTPARLAALLSPLRVFSPKR